MTMLFPKTRDEWLELRWQFISSTESAALFGMSPYLTAYELAVEKSAEKRPDDYLKNERMSWGLRLQRAIAEGVANDYGVKVRAISGYAVQPQAKMGASFDYEIVGIKDDFPADGNNMLRSLYRQHGAGVLEIKNVDAWEFKQNWAAVTEESGDADGEQVDTFAAPDHIECQVQHQLHCIEREWAAIGVLVGGNRQITLWRMRDHDAGNIMAARAKDFWANLAKKIYPPVDLPRDAMLIRKLYRYADPDAVLDIQKVDTDDAKLIEELAVKMFEASSRKTTAEKEQKSLQAELFLLVGKASKALLKSGSISLGTTSDVEVAAHTRAGYRMCRFYPKKAAAEKGKKK